MEEKLSAPALVGVEGKKMLSVDISICCDLECEGCFTDYGRQASTDMNRLGIESRLLSLDQIDLILSKAKKIGFESVLTAGQGEPAVDRGRFWSFIQIVNKYEMTPVVVTHGLWVTPEDADRLWNSNVTVLGKLWSLSEEKSRRLLKDKKNRPYIDFRGARIPVGTANIITRYTSAEAIKHRGYKLALNTLINSVNASNVLDILRWDRTNEILPYFEFIFSSGRALENESLWLDGAGGRTLREAPYTEVKEREKINELIVKEDRRLGFTYPLVKVQAQKAGQNVFNNAQTVFINPFGYRTSCIAIGEVMRDGKMPIHAAEKPDKVLTAKLLPPCLTGEYACGADKYDREIRKGIR